jgi:DNA replication protein DnaC
MSSDFGFSPDRIARLQRVVVPDEPTPEEAIAQRERAEIARLAQHMLQCGAPQKAVNVVTAGTRPTEASKAVAEWLPGNVQFLLLLGYRGSGKTVAAVEALKSARKTVHFMGSDGPIKSWVYSPELAQFVDAEMLKAASYRDDGGTLHAMARAVPLLIIDDLGVEVPDGAGIWQAALDGLIKRREGAMLRTIITSNADGAKFRSVYGDRVYSRIKGNGTVCNCGNLDLRLHPLPPIEPCDVRPA